MKESLIIAVILGLGCMLGAGGVRAAGNSSEGGCLSDPTKCGELQCENPEEQGYCVLDIYGDGKSSFCKCMTPPDDDKEGPDTIASPSEPESITRPGLVPDLNFPQ